MVEKTVELKGQWLAVRWVSSMVAHLVDRMVAQMVAKMVV